MREPLTASGQFAPTPVYLTSGDGRLYVVLDTGAVGNLCGDRWAQRVAAAAVQHQQRPSQQRLARTLEVGGVGKGTQKAFYEATLPLAMPTEGGASVQNISVPMVNESDLPCLWGLTSLTRNRAIINLMTNELHLCGPGDATVQLPPGTTSVRMERDTRSGHLLIPCDHYVEAAQAAATDPAPLAPRVLHTTETTGGGASSSSSAAPAPKAGARGPHRQ